MAKKNKGLKVQRFKNLMVNCKEEKKSIRQKILALRDNLSKEVILKKSKLIEGYIEKLEEFKKADIVMFFVTFKSEPNMLPIIQKALKAGKRVVLPQVVNKQNKELSAVEIRDVKKDLKKGAYGIQEPYKTEDVMPVNQIGLILVPGAVFDENGSRIGYGGGYYDCFLKNVPVKKRVAVAFEIQVVDEVPCGKYDQRVGKIVTEKGVITCTR